MKKVIAMILLLYIFGCGRLEYPLSSGRAVILPVCIEKVDPTWSPDCERVAFVQEIDSDENISYVRKFDTTIVEITNGTYPNWNEEDGITYVRFMDGHACILEISLSKDGNNVIFTITPADLGLPPGTPPEGLCRDMKRSKDSILIEDAQSRIWLISLVDSSLTFLIEGNNPDFSPDARKIVYENSGIHIYHLDDETSYGLTISGSSPVFSPNGQKIAYTDDMWVYIITLGEAGATRYPVSSTVTSLSWSPDEDWIAYRRDDTGVIEALSPYLPHEPNK